MNAENVIKLKSCLQEYLGAEELLDELCKALATELLGDTLQFIADMYDISLTAELIEDDYE